MTVAYSKFGVYLTRTPASGTFTGATDQKSGQAFNAASGAGERITRASATPSALTGTWDTNPLSYFTMFAEFTITTLPASGNIVGLVNGGLTGYNEPERSLLLECSGSTYYIRVSLGQGNAAAGPRFTLASAPATGTTLRCVVAFPVAGANAGVVYSADQNTYLNGARLYMTGGISNQSPASITNFDITAANDDGLIDRVAFLAGVYGALLDGKVTGGGWGWVGTNSMVAGDITDYVANGAGAGAAPPTFSGDLSITAAGQDVTLSGTIVSSATPTATASINDGTTTTGPTSTTITGTGPYTASYTFVGAAPGTYTGTIVATNTGGSLSKSTSTNSTNPTSVAIAAIGAYDGPGAITIAASQSFLRMAIGETRAIKIKAVSNSTGAPVSGYTFSAAPVAPSTATVTVSGPTDSLGIATVTITALAVGDIIVNVT